VKRAALTLLALAALLLAACGGEDDPTGDAIEAEAATRTPYIPKNDVEFNNFNDQQKLADDPNTIIWCTAFPSSSTAPIVTVPIKGKLTSSSTSFEPPEDVEFNENAGAAVTTRRSVDGLYHKNPPPYRFGFTPGGQYVDFTEVETICTTQPLDFQKESIAVSSDPGFVNADNEAQAALEAGDAQEAEDILKEAAGE
jgi:hypothetical protein